METKVDIKSVFELLAAILAAVIAWFKNRGDK